MDGLITRWKNKSATWVTKTVAMDGPWSVAQVTSVSDNSMRRKLTTQRRYDIRYGFEFAGELFQLVSRENFPDPGDRWFDFAGDSTLFERIKDHVGRSRGDLINAMDQVWPDPEPGAQVSYLSLSDPSNLEILGRQTLKDFPAPGSNTDVLSVKIDVGGDMETQYEFLHAPAYGQKVSYAYKGRWETGSARLIHARLGIASRERRGFPKTPKAVVAAANEAINVLDADDLAGLSPPGTDSGIDDQRQRTRDLFEHFKRAVLFIDVSLKVVGVNHDRSDRARVLVEPRFPTRPASIVRNFEITVEKIGDEGWALRTPAQMLEAIIQGLGIAAEQVR